MSFALVFKKYVFKKQNKLFEYIYSGSDLTPCSKMTLIVNKMDTNNNTNTFVSTFHELRTLLNLIVSLQFWVGYYYYYPSFTDQKVECVEYK